MTKENLPKTSVNNSEEISGLQSEIRAYENLFQLQNEPYFRQRVLYQLDRIAAASERQADALEASLQDSSEEVKVDEEVSE